MDRSASGAEGYRFEPCRGYSHRYAFSVGAMRCSLAALGAKRTTETKQVQSATFQLQRMIDSNRLLTTLFVR
jgi:hypothetical protein